MALPFIRKAHFRGSTARLLSLRRFFSLITLRDFLASLSLKGFLAWFALLMLLFLVLWMTGCGQSSKGHPFNVVLISLDTVRFDALSRTGNPLAHTPNLDALARKGVYFTGAISTNSQTTPAHASLFTGRFPTAHGVRSNDFHAVSASEVTLAEFLKEHRYHTAGFVSAFPVSHRYGFSQGFDIYSDQIDNPEKEKSANPRFEQFAHRPAADVANAVLSWMNGERPANQPFFLFIHFYDAHWPYSPPPEFLERLGTTTEQRYAGEIAYIDSELGKILNGFEQAGLLSDTLFVVTADHGEALGDHGEEQHGFFIYDSTIRIPLFFSGGPILKEKTFPDQVGLIDIFPTIVDLLGLPVPLTLQGRSLKNILTGAAGTVEDRPYYIESFLPQENFGWSPLVGLRRSSIKLIRAPRSELYDLAKDSGEADNVYESNKEKTRALESELTDFLKTITVDSAGSQAHLKKEELEMLDSLGYVGAGMHSVNRGDLADPKDRISFYTRMKKARMNIQQGEEVEAAVSELKKLVEEDPDNMTFRFSVGKVLLLLNRKQEGESYLEDLLSKEPDFPQALNELASLKLERQEWDQAARYFQKSLEISPIQIELYPNLALALTQMNRLPEAVSLLDEALKRFPEDASLHATRGGLAFQTKDYGTAAEHFSIAHKADPKDLEAARNYARALLVSGHAAQGVQILEPLAPLAEKDVEFQLLFGQCLAQAGQFQEGMCCFEKVLSLEDRPSAHYFMGLCLLKMGKVDEAESHFNRLHRSDPNFEMSRQALKQYKTR